MVRAVRVMPSNLNNTLTYASNIHVLVSTSRLFPPFYILQALKLRMRNRVRSCCSMSEEQARHLSRTLGLIIFGANTYGLRQQGHCGGTAAFNTILLRLYRTNTYSTISTVLVHLLASCSLSVVSFVWSSLSPHPPAISRKASYIASLARPETQWHPQCLSKMTSSHWKLFL